MSSTLNILSTNAKESGIKQTAGQTMQSLRLLAHLGPRIQCITNPVAMDFSADILLAVGAQTSMTMGMDEIAEFVTSADCLSVNTGTLDSTRRAAIDTAVQTAIDFNKPWVLDPVSVHASSTRRSYAQGLLEFRPSVIRGNYAEIHALANDESANAPQKLARQTGAVVVQSGETDLITDGRRTLLMTNGSVLQTRVAAMGCASSALIGGFLAVNPDPFEAAVHALLTIGVAAEESVKLGTGPGSFKMHLLDCIYNLNEDLLVQRGRIVQCEEVAGS
ncbi:hydroxyethylthiazole kinase [Motiliproteus coralliicola]|nr:hydroxyethylthiazole kinase [Motiliproteus coralliicola]